MRRICLIALMLLGCGGSGSGTDAAGGPGGLALTPDAATAATGGAAGAVYDATGGTGSGSGGSGGMPADAGVASVAGSGGTSDSGSLPSPDAGETPPPYQCAGMHVPASGVRPPGCMHPALAQECRSNDPALFPPAPCDLSNPNLYLALCLIKSSPCMVDDQCCGSRLSGATAETKCSKEMAGDFFGHCQ